MNADGAQFPVLPYPPLEEGDHQDVNQAFAILSGAEVVYYGYSEHVARLIYNTMQHSLIEGEEL